MPAVSIVLMLIAVMISFICGTFVRRGADRTIDGAVSTSFAVVLGVTTLVILAMTVYLAE